MKSYNSEEDKKKRRIIYIILIILLLCLITSCSCSCNLWGQIGDWFSNIGNYDIDDDSGDQGIIRNKDLRFDTNKLEMSLSDYETKVSFTYENINPSTFTCQTSDASIATCYVKDGYVVVIPKRVGNVIVTLETETNGKKYEATLDVTITEASKHIVLSSTRGTINLAYTNQKLVSYTLVGIKGNVTVTSSDASIATGAANDGILKIVATKTGTAKITLSVRDNGTTYTTVYIVTVTNKKNTTTDNTKPGENVDKDENSNNYLSNINSPKYPLNETFNKNKNNYTIDVDYNANTIPVIATAESNKSKIDYKLNGNVVTDPNNIPLNEGDNKLEITVTAPNGDKNTYTVTIHKPVRTIEFEQDSYKVGINGYPINIIYNVYEDGNLISDYNVNDITASISNYNGKYEVNKGYITLRPDVTMADVTSIMKINYNNKESITKLVFEMTDYYLYSYPSAYVISLINGTGYKNLILNTNLFEEEIKVIPIANGIRLQSATGDIYVDVTTDNSNFDLSLEDTKATNSLVIKATASDEGVATIKAVGYAYGKKINELDLFVTATAKSIVTIDANGGFFDEFTNLYQFQVTKDDTINLADYTPLKVDESGNCMYYELLNYNTEPDGSGATYSKDQVLTNITGPVTLYAIYKDESVYKDLKTNKKLYLTDVNLFHNEEYFQKYGEDKVIYPGAHGAYVMTITNNSASEITITGMTLEENTICIPDKGCLNMGYKIRHAAPSELYKYYYGSSEQYTVLNKDGNRDIAKNYSIKDISFETGITISKGSSAEITLFWEWVSDDNELDTLIGEQDINPNDEYEITVSINFETNNKYCVKD